ncbi:hypothetical protein HK098_007631 [Nowakowskiella sp. JEL0407]|nr:hypothetical protein HK098_007631 [Nowakowskiella sp. JEL0407]
MALRVLVTRQLPPLAQSQLLSQQAHFELVQWESADTPIPRDALLAHARSGVDAVLCLISDKIDKEFLSVAGPRLKVVSTMSVGLDHISLPAPSIRIGYTPDVLTATTADLTMGLLLATTRLFPSALSSVKNGTWGAWKPTWMTGIGIEKKVVGIVGFGRIGRAVAERLVGFNIGKLLYSTSSGNPHDPSSFSPLLSVLSPSHVPFTTLLSHSDIIIITCALTPSTHNLFSTAQFLQMKPSSILINTSRGPVLNQSDLLTALSASLPHFKDRVNGDYTSSTAIKNSQYVGGPLMAGLDVTTPEPVPVNHPLLELENCVVLPHIGSATIETREEMARVAVVNCLGLLGVPGFKVISEYVQ